MIIFLNIDFIIALKYWHIYEILILLNETETQIYMLGFTMTIPDRWVQGENTNSWIMTGMCDSYQYGGDKLVEKDDLDASHSQWDQGVNFGHVQIGVSFCCICVVYHAEGKHFLICYRHSLRNEWETIRHN